MSRFAVLVHDFPVLHWDFLLENGSGCRTWRLLSEPGETSTIAAQPLPDHRLLYLEYEGPVSRDRGTVAAFDRGTFEWISNGPERLEVVLKGDRLNCSARLVGNSDGVCQWEFVRTSDARL